MRFLAWVCALVLWASVPSVPARLSTNELLECRANLSSAIRNDSVFLGEVERSDYIFTGKIKDIRGGHLHARVKRTIKGSLNASVDLALNDTCGFYIRRGYTGIFLARKHRGHSDLRHAGKIVMHFGPVPLTLANLDRINAVVRGELVKQRYLSSVNFFPGTNGKFSL